MSKKYIKKLNIGISYLYSGGDDRTIYLNKYHSLYLRWEYYLVITICIYILYIERSNGRNEGGDIDGKENKPD